MVQVRKVLGWDDVMEAGVLEATSLLFPVREGLFHVFHKTVVDWLTGEITEGSSLTDAGDAALDCLLTVRHNKAETGNGGGYAVSGDSSVSLPVSTAVFSQNVAAQQGGGLFIGAGAAEFDSSKAKEFGVAKVTFWRLDLVDNASPTGDGGGVCVRKNNFCCWMSVQFKLQ